MHYFSVLSRKLFNETDESTVFNNNCAFWFMLHWTDRFAFRDYEFWVVTRFINDTDIYINALNFVKEAKISTYSTSQKYAHFSFIFVAIHLCWIHMIQLLIPFSATSMWLSKRC